MHLSRALLKRIRRMIRIAITPAANAAIAATLALGTVAVEPERAQDGGVHIWLDPGVLAKLKALRGPSSKAVCFDSTSRAPFIEA
jgi:hypothetical protein